MQLNTLVSHIDQTINHYLQLSRTTVNNRQITAASEEISNLTKRQGFLEAAIFLMRNGAANDKDKDMLLTSLIKDKFKYDYEALDTNYLQEYYSGLCEIACLPRIADTVAAKNACLALAYVYINHTSQEALPLSHFLSPLAPAEWSRFHPYFGVLEYIASELDNGRLVVDETSRDVARRRAKEQQQEVLRMLNEKGRELGG